jgi:hypothetical protein
VEPLPYALTGEIPGLPPTINQMLAATPWARKQIRDVWHAKVKLMVGRNKPEKPLAEAHLTLVRCSSKEPDILEGAASFKYCVDALRYCGVLEDDKTENISFEYRWQKTKPRHGMVKIAIEEGKR